jgi:octaprenyl-diphosphate synthase
MSIQQLEHVVAASSEQVKVSPEFLTGAMHQLEKLMHEAVDSEVEILRDASRHILEAGGKRIRPRLVLLSFAACGGEDLTPVMPVAAAVELVHTASVVHDDINDHGVLRRGRPSVNSIWGRTFALLTGDFLFTKVYELMAPYEDLNIVLAEATSALVEGETLQAAAVKENNFTRETYYRIIALKTAALFRAAARLGAELARADDALIDALSQYGYQIGLAFQIIDDVLDIVGSSEQLGKTSGIDVAQGRGFAVAYRAAHVEENTEDPMAAIRRKVMDGDTLQEAYAQAHRLVEMAVAALEPLPESEAKRALVELAISVVERSA